MRKYSLRVVDVIASFEGLFMPRQVILVCGRYELFLHIYACTTARILEITQQILKKQVEFNLVSGTMVLSV